MVWQVIGKLKPIIKLAQHFNLPYSDEAGNKKTNVVTSAFQIS